jgi:hypothetical protein
VSFARGGRIYLMKKSFIVYLDSLNILSELTTQQAGELFIAIYNYHLRGEMPTEFWVKMALASFINQWQRDCERYEETCNRNKANGLKGGRPPKNQNNPMGSSETQKTQLVISKPKKADNDNDKDNDNVTDKVTKEKKSIQKKIETPTLEEVKTWFIEQGSTAEQGAKAWQYYTDGNWHDAKGQPVKNWRQKMRGGRWLEVQAQKQNEGNQYQNLTHESNYQNLTELNDFFTAE